VRWQAPLTTITVLAERKGPSTLPVRKVEGRKRTRSPLVAVVGGGKTLVYFRSGNRKKRREGGGNLNDS
jgi:hypothetical protein